MSWLIRTIRGFFSQAEVPMSEKTSPNPPPAKDVRLYVPGMY